MIFLDDQWSHFFLEDLSFVSAKVIANMITIKVWQCLDSHLSTGGAGWNEGSISGCHDTSVVLHVMIWRARTRDVSGLFVTIRDSSWLMTNVNLMRLLVTPWPWNNGAGSNRDGSMARELRRVKPWLTKNARNKAWYYRYLSILWCYFCWNRWVLRKCNRCNMHQDTETVIICDFWDIFRLQDVWHGKQCHL